MKVLVVVQVWKKAYNTDNGKEIKGLKDGPEHPDYWKSTVLYYCMDNSYKHLSFFNTWHPWKKQGQLSPTAKKQWTIIKSLTYCWLSFVSM